MANAMEYVDIVISRVESLGFPLNTFSRRIGSKGITI